jgi:hypothetical protein
LAAIREPCEEASDEVQEAYLGNADTSDLFPEDLEAGP